MITKQPEDTDSENEDNIEQKLIKEITRNQQEQNEENDGGDDKLDMIPGFVEFAADLPNEHPARNLVHQFIFNNKNVLEKHKKLCIPIIFDDALLGLKDVFESQAVEESSDVEIEEYEGLSEPEE